MAKLFKGRMDPKLKLGFIIGAVLVSLAIVSDKLSLVFWSFFGGAACVATVVVYTLVTGGIGSYLVMVEKKPDPEPNGGHPQPGSRC